MKTNSRIRWAYINRDKDLEKQPRLNPADRANPKRKSKPKGSKTRDKLDEDTKEVVRDKDLKKD